MLVNSASMKDGWCEGGWYVRQPVEGSQYYNNW